MWILGREQGVGSWEGGKELTHAGPEKLGMPWRILGRGGKGLRERERDPGGWGTVSRAWWEARGVAWVTQECGLEGGGTEVLGDATPTWGD